MTSNVSTRSSIRRYTRHKLFLPFHCLIESRATDSPLTRLRRANISEKATVAKHIAWNLDFSIFLSPGLQEGGASQALRWRPERPVQLSFTLRNIVRRAPQQLRQSALPSLNAQKRRKSQPSGPLRTPTGEPHAGAGLFPENGMF